MAQSCAKSAKPSRSMYEMFQTVSRVSGCRKEKDGKTPKKSPVAKNSLALQLQVVERCQKLEETLDGARLCGADGLGSAGLPFRRTCCGTLKRCESWTPNVKVT